MKNLPVIALFDHIGQHAFVKEINPFPQYPCLLDTTFTYYLIIKSPG